MPNKDELLRSIAPGMRLDKAFFLSIYGYEISYPGFSETAIKALEDEGCGKARSYYDQIVAEYENDEKRNNGLKEAAEWLRKENDRKYENMVKEYERKDGEGLRKQETIQNLTRSELTELCKKLLKEGIINSPEQFAMVVNPD